MTYSSSSYNSYEVTSHAQYLVAIITRSLAFEIGRAREIEKRVLKKQVLIHLRPDSESWPVYWLCHSLHAFLKRLQLIPSSLTTWFLWCMWRVCWQALLLTMVFGGFLLVNTATQYHPYNVILSACSALISATHISHLHIVVAYILRIFCLLLRQKAHYHALLDNMTYWQCYVYVYA
jgi:hypothetical protein